MVPNGVEGVPLMADLLMKPMDVAARFSATSYVTLDSKQSPACVANRQQLSVLVFDTARVPINLQALDQGIIHCHHIRANCRVVIGLHVPKL